MASRCCTSKLSTICKALIIGLYIAFGAIVFHFGHQQDDHFVDALSVYSQQNNICWKPSTYICLACTHTHALTC